MTQEDHSAMPGDIALSIINDGDTYQRHLEIARCHSTITRFKRWSVRVDNYALLAQTRFGQTFTMGELLTAVQELDSYYAEHVREIDECNAGLR